MIFLALLVFSGRGRRQNLARFIAPYLALSLVLAGLQPETLSAGYRRTRYYAPSITTQPVSQAVVAGQSASFSVAVTGSAPLIYQWKKNGTSIFGANSSTYTTPPTTLADTGALFTVVVGNYAGRAASRAATLVVTSAPAGPTTTAPTTTTTTTTTATTPTTNTSTPPPPPPAGSATLVFAPLSLSFGSVTIGGSSTLNVTLSNSGTADGSITNVSLSGPGFSLSGAPTGQTLAPGQSIVLNLTFAPAAAGSVTGGLTVTGNATNSPLTLGLSGNGVQPPVTHSTSLTWSPGPSPIIGYNVYRSTVSGGAYGRLNGTPVTATGYIDSGVQSGSTYYYVATSTDGTAESAYSGEISATVP